MPANNINAIMHDTEKQNGLVFFIFCAWTFVLLCRPQDVFPVLEPLRPALVTGVLTLLVVVKNLRTLSTYPVFQEDQVKYYTALLLIMVIGIPFSLYARLSFMALFTGYINTIIFFFIFYKVVDSVKKLSTVLLIACIGNGLYSFYSVTKGNLGSGGRLAFGSMFDPNDLAFFALAFLPINLIFISRDNPLWVRLISLGCFGIGIQLILLTGSRGGLLGLVLAAALLLLLKTKTIRFSIKVVLIALCLLIVNYSPINTERLMSILNIEEDYNVQGEEGRLAIWKSGLRSMLARPLTGVGMDCFNNAVGNDRVARGAETIRWQTAHNSLVQIGTETGVIGLTIFLLLSWKIFIIFLKVKKVAESAMLIKIGEMGFVGFAGMFVSAMFLSQAYSMYWAFYVVFSAVVNQLLARELSYASGQK